MKYSSCILLGFLVLVGFVPDLGTPLPMTNDDAASLVSLDSGEKTRELPHMVIAPRKPKLLQENLTEQPHTGLYDTIVEQLQAAGVQTAEKRQLETLSYKELNRLLALWHMTQRRNFYDANENRAPPAFEEDVVEPAKQQVKHASQ